MEKTSGSVFNKNKLYWILQLSGWFLYVSLSAFISLLGKDDPSVTLFISVLIIFIGGLSITHLYRNRVIKWGWAKYSFGKLTPRVFLSSIVMSLMLVIPYIIIVLLISEKEAEGYFPGKVLQEFIGGTILFFMWSLIYFIYQYFHNYRMEEIKNLQWEASRNEIELNQLKSQLNPHFLFNSMNSIKALIDENPFKAKEAIIQLSGILRNTLLYSRKKFISLKQELELVQDYLSLESVRYEERLKYNIDFPRNSLNFKVPPLIIQTLVENAIKHGISKSPDGGFINIIGALDMEVGLIISIENSGDWVKKQQNTTGLGIKNVKKRLHLLYGEDGTFDIKHSDGKVMISILIPLNGIL